MALERLSRRVAAITESATLAVDARAKALKAAGEPVIGFGAGEPDFPTPAHVVESAIAACSDPKNHRYTPAGGLPELKEAVVAKTLRDSGVEFLAGQVAGPVEHVWLEQSYHVATIDHDGPEVSRRIVEFALKVTA